MQQAYQSRVDNLTRSYLHTMIVWFSKPKFAGVAVFQTCRQDNGRKIWQTVCACQSRTACLKHSPILSIALTNCLTIVILLSVTCHPVVWLWSWQENCCNTYSSWRGLTLWFCLSSTSQQLSSKTCMTWLPISGLRPTCHLCNLALRTPQCLRSSRCWAHGLDLDSALNGRHPPLYTELDGDWIEYACLSYIARCKLIELCCDNAMQHLSKKAIAYFITTICLSTTANMTAPSHGYDFVWLSVTAICKW